MSFAEGLAAHQKGRFSEAETIYKEILKANPTDFASMHMLGVITLQTGRAEQGIKLIRKAISINENVADAHSNLGNGLRDSKLLDEALASYDKAIALKPDHSDAFNNRGIVLSDLKRLEEALASYDKAIALKPDHSAAYENRGNALRDLNRHEEALASYDKAIAVMSDNAQAHNSRGNTLMVLKRFEEALASYDKAIALEPLFASAYVNRGVALFELKRPVEALASYDRAIALKPQAEAYNNRGSALRSLNRNEEALSDYEKSIELKPDYFEAYKNRGNTLWDLNRPDEALTSYETAIALKPDDADAHNNRGVALWGLKRLAEALDSYDRSIALKPDHAEAYNNRGAALLDLNRHDEAMASLDMAIALQPDYPDAYQTKGSALAMLKRYNEAFVVYDKLFRIAPHLRGIEGNRLHIKMQLCDWTNLENEAAHLVRSVRSGLVATQPFFFLNAPSNSRDQLQCSQSWVRSNFPPFEKPIWRGERYDHARIRIAYVSADFRHHPTSYLMAGLFECHDKSRFEVTAIALGAEENSEIRQRIRSSFERFIEADFYTDAQIAELVKSLQVDILVDLMGFTTNARTAIFARRPAPIQVSYLGYPGTMGAPYIDYIIADQIVIPENHREFYTEKVVFMPNSYWVNDSTRAISETDFAREGLGLPPGGFVFCCFNNTYKITPPVFGCWMRILKQVPGSVLWLLESSAKATINLRKEAEERGVDSGRLVFAKRMPPPDHLARHRAANLCLDTLPYNAHTTASDALWAGTPVVTCIGETFAGRVAASLLYALRMPELVTTNQQDYEKLAIELATCSEKLTSIRSRLARNRLITPLFDTAGFTRHIEAAFSEMVARRNAGIKPSDIFVVN